MKNSFVFILFLSFFGLVACAQHGEVSKPESLYEEKKLTTRDGFDFWYSTPDKPYEIKEQLPENIDTSHCQAGVQCQPRIIPWSMDNVISYARERGYDFVFYQTIYVNQHQPNPMARQVGSLGVYTEL